MTELAVRTNLRTLMRSDDVTSRFSEVVGNGNAGAYISSVLIAVSENNTLQECTPNSIIGSALRAATMRLSCDPSTGQAYLVPFKGRATLIVGWKGIYHMAIRTGKYRFINLITVYEGEEVTEDRMTGMQTLSGRRESDKVIGYMLYFQLVTGFSKTFYMTVEECEAHGAKYSKNFNNSNSLWKTDKAAMYKKTVMRLGLTRWGYLDPADVQSIKSNEEDAEIIDGETGEIINAQGVTMDIEPPAGMTAKKAMSDLGFDEPEEPPAPEEPPVEEPETMASNDPELPFSNAQIVKAFADKKGLSLKDASAGLYELHRAGKIGAKLTVSQAKML